MAWLNPARFALGACRMATKPCLVSSFLAKRRERAARHRLCCARRTARADVEAAFRSLRHGRKSCICRPGIAFPMTVYRPAMMYWRNGYLHFPLARNEAPKAPSDYTHAERSCMQRVRREPIMAAGQASRARSTVDMDELTAWLAGNGFSDADRTRPGEFACVAAFSICTRRAKRNRSGSTFSATLWRSLRSFDADTQRTTSTAQGTDARRR